MYCIANMSGIKGHPNPTKSKYLQIPHKISTKVLFLSRIEEALLTCC
jgi:hypothetical protein